MWSDLEKMGLKKLEKYIGIEILKEKIKGKTLIEAGHYSFKEGPNELDLFL